MNRGYALALLLTLGVIAGILYQIDQRLYEIAVALRYIT